MLVHFETRSRQRRLVSAIENHRQQRLRLQSPLLRVWCVYSTTSKDYHRAVRTLPQLRHIRHHNHTVILSRSECSIF